MKGFAFGQYYPANSVLHRLDPRTKVLAAVIYIVASFLCKNTFSFVLLLFSSLALILISRIPIKVVLRSVRALIFIMTFTALTGAVSHFAFGGAPDLLVLILCVVFTLLWARIAAVLANKSSPKVLNRVTGIILTVLGTVILGVNFFFS